MTPILIEGPRVEPVDLYDLKMHLRVDLDDTAQDSVIEGLAKAARVTVEAATRRMLNEQRWQLLLDRWPPDRVVLPFAPIIAIDGIGVFADPDSVVEVPISTIVAGFTDDPPWFQAPGAPQPGIPRNGISIMLRAGYGDSTAAVPEPLRLAVKLLTAHWFESRGDVAGEQVLPPDIQALLAPYRRLHL